MTFPMAPRVSGSRAVYAVRAYVRAKSVAIRCPATHSSCDTAAGLCLIRAGLISMPANQLAAAARRTDAS